MIGDSGMVQVSQKKDADATKSLRTSCFIGICTRQSRDLGPLGLECILFVQR